MMKLAIQPSFLTGTITAPASKSAMQRACALALLHIGNTLIRNPGLSNDDKAALLIIQDLGAAVKKNEDGTISISGTSVTFLNNRNASSYKVIHCGESGLSVRMFTPIAASFDETIQINGSGSLLTRPIDFFDAILPQLGVQIISNKGKLPLKITGPLQPAAITVDGSLSSQFLTGMLMAYGTIAKEPVTITVTNLKSKPYIDLTLQMMKLFGYNISHDQYKTFTILPATKQTSTVDYTVEGDWSGAAFLLVAGAIAGDITVKGLNVFSAQADKAILQALIASKAIISITPECIKIKKGILHPFHFDATDCPDLFPPLVVLAAYCNGTSVIEGVSRLVHKESNRALTLQEEFGKMGLVIKLQHNLMIIEGGLPLTGTQGHSRHDHRIAMALAIAALGATGETSIEESEAINKSYPDFYQHIASLGAALIYPS
ncbi:MAG: 3-phosphoshikimate 1-carboxyvinyltransferase [Ferruginibacter sp.]